MNETEIEELKNECIARWTSGFLHNDLDERLENFSDRFIEWFTQVDENYHPTVKLLLENLNYYLEGIVNTYFKTADQQLRLVNNTITDQNTIYLSIKHKEWKSNSSSYYHANYIRINRINKHITSLDTNLMDDDIWERIDNIVFIDDCIGTGNSLIKELEKSQTRYQHKNVYFIVVHAMDEGIGNLESYATDNDIRFNAIAYNRETKIFSGTVFPDNTYARNTIVNMSTQLNIPPQHRLGYENSESLMVFDNNTPNNTLGFIWCDVRDGYFSIFPRQNDQKPEWRQEQDSRGKRKKVNYNNATIGIVIDNDKSYIKLFTLIYFKQTGKRYKLKELLKTLGFDNVQLTDLLEDLISNELIKYKDDLLSITEKGIRTLVACNAFYFTLDKTDNELKDINKKNVMSLNEPYVPENFSAKV